MKVMNGWGMKRQVFLAITVGLIVGMLAGFGGGYYWQKNKADALTTTPPATTYTSSNALFTSLTGDRSGTQGQIIMTAIGNSWVEFLKSKGNGDAVKGMKLIAGSSTGFNVPRSWANTVMSMAIKKVQAARSCSSIEINFATDGIRQAFEKGLALIQDYCTLFFDFKGTLDISIYTAPIKDSVIPVGDYYSKFTLDGESTRYYSYPSGNKCLQTFDKTPMRLSSIVRTFTNFDGGSSDSEFVPKIPDGAILICSSKITVEILQIKNPNYDASKCCGAKPVNPVQGGSEKNT